MTSRWEIYEHTPRRRVWERTRCSWGGVVGSVRGFTAAQGILARTGVRQTVGQQVLSEINR